MLTFIIWCQQLPLAQAIRSVKWPYPSIEIVHLAGLVIVFGSILVVNLRVFGALLKQTPVAEVARGIAPLTLFGLGLQVISGPLLFITSAMKFYESGAFQLKLFLLAIALLYHFAIHRPATFSPDAPLTKLRISAALSMALWMGVVLAGLSIELLV